MTPLEYKIRKPNGATVGPLAYAKIVESVATGQIDGNDDISIAGGEFQPLSSVKDLYRHVPASRMTPTTTRVESAAVGGPKRELRGRRLRCCAHSHSGHAPHGALALRAGRRPQRGLYQAWRPGVRHEQPRGRATRRVPRHEAGHQSQRARHGVGRHAALRRQAGRYARCARARRAARALSAHCGTGPREASRLVHVGLGHGDLLRRGRPAQQRLSVAPRCLGDSRPGLAAANRRGLREHAHPGTGTALRSSRPIGSIPPWRPPPCPTTFGPPFGSARRRTASRKWRNS